MGSYIGYATDAQDSYVAGDTIEEVRSKAARVSPIWDVRNESQTATGSFEPVKTPPPPPPPAAEPVKKKVKTGKLAKSPNASSAGDDDTGVSGAVKQRVGGTLRMKRSDAGLTSGVGSGLTI